MHQTYQVHLQPYQIPLSPPLRTAHGTWSIRRGAIVTLTPLPATLSPAPFRRQGEIAPLPQFGSETLAQALTWVESLQGTITHDQIFAIPDRLPCCQFAFETALLPSPPASPPPIAALLPAGRAALTHWQTPYQRGHRTFKWKIGLFPNELELLALLLAQLPSDTKLRLDANAALTLEQTLAWLDRTDRSPQIEYLEQPLADLETMLAIAPHYSTALALDESIASLQQLQAAYHLGWRGIFVIKPAIVGSPKKLIEFCQQFQPDTVFSSVFETPIGRQHGINLAHACGSDRPLGYGTADWLLE